MAGSLAAPDVTAIPLGRPSPGASSNQPERQGLRTGPARLAAPRIAPIRFCSRRGLPCRRRCRRRGALLPHPFTLAGQAFAGGRRFAFCGAVPGVAPAGRYPAPCPHGARTFLRPKATAVRPTGGRHRAAGGRVKGCDVFARIEAHQNDGRTSGVGEKRDGRRNVLLDVLPELGPPFEAALILSGPSRLRRRLGALRARLADAMGRTLARLRAAGLTPWIEPRGGLFVWARRARRGRDRPPRARRRRRLRARTRVQRRAGRLRLSALQRRREPQPARLRRARAGDGRPDGARDLMLAIHPPFTTSAATLC